MRKSLAFIFLALGLSVLLAGCSKEASTLHSSPDGNMPEAFLPADAAMVFSFSLMEEGQYDNVQTLNEKLGRETSLSSTFMETFAGDLDAVGLDYEEDLMPAFGEQYRMVMAANEATYTVVTLESPKQMKKLLEELAETGSLEAKTLSDMDAYVDEESSFYAAVQEDLLLVSSTAEGLLGMSDQDEGDSLWADGDYQDSLMEMGDDYMFYALFYPADLSESSALSGGLALGSVSDAVEKQYFVLRAEEDGVRLDGQMSLDKKLAKESGVSLDEVPKAAPYLVDELPGDDLIFLAESYALQAAMEQAYLLEAETEGLLSVETFVQQYFGMDLREEVLTFMDKGYALALHQNGAAVFPGVTVYVDASGDVDNASRFVDKLDGQITGLQLALESTFPGAVSKGVVTVDGQELSALTLDFSNVSHESSAALPAAVTAEPIQLLYGLLDDRLILSTALAWQDDFEVAGDGDLYEALVDKLDYAEGLFLLDVDSAVGYMNSLFALREQLDLEVNRELDFEELFDGFVGAAMASETKAYETSLGGFLLIE